MLATRRMRECSAGHEEMENASSANFEGCVREAFLSVGGSRRLRFLEMTCLPALVQGESLYQRKEENRGGDQGKGLAEGFLNAEGYLTKFRQPTTRNKTQPKLPAGKSSVLDTVG